MNIISPTVLALLAVVVTEANLFREHKRVFPQFAIRNSKEVEETRRDEFDLREDGEQSQRSTESKKREPDTPEERFAVDEFDLREEPTPKRSESSKKRGEETPEKRINSEEFELREETDTPASEGNEKRDLETPDKRGDVVDFELREDGVPESEGTEKRDLESPNKRDNTEDFDFRDDVPGSEGNEKRDLESPDKRDMDDLDLREEPEIAEKRDLDSPMKRENLLDLDLREDSNAHEKRNLDTPEKRDTEEEFELREDHEVRRSEGNKRDQKEPRIAKRRFQKTKKRDDFDLEGDKVKRDQETPVHQMLHKKRFAGLRGIGNQMYRRMMKHA